MKKVWFITGCSKGFGRCITEQLLTTTDHIVVATARNPETLDDLVERYPDKLCVQKLDVTQPADIQSAVSETIKKYQRIDVLVNNAGYGLVGLLEECEMIDIRDIFNTNVFGLMNVTQEILPIMRKANGGHIFNFSSIAGLVSYASMGIYNSTKFAVEGLSEALAKEVQSFGINVTIVEPGPFRTDFFGGSIKTARLHEAYDNSQIVVQTRAFMSERNQKNDQEGDPVKAAQVIIKLTDMSNPPLRILLGNRAVDEAREKLTKQLSDISEYESLSRSADYSVAQ
jgi:NADP-dependent 3-hydroxy acid dehydrogenase YdfG